MDANISAVLIVKNEEAVIERCLKSLVGLDEIVVLDTGSTDNTVEACRQIPNARVVRTEPIVPFHFAEARNRALALVETPWAFTIDADEVLRPGGVRKMRDAIKDPANAAFPGFACTFINQVDDRKDALQVTTFRVKLFRKDAWTWRHRVHEELEPLKPPAELGNLAKVAVEHLPPAGKNDRRDRNLELLELQAKEEPDYLRTYRHLGQEYMLLKEWAKALPHLTRFAEQNKEGNFETSVAVQKIGQCHLEMEDKEEAIRWFTSSAEIDKRRREPLYLAAACLINGATDTRPLERAVPIVERLLAIPHKDRPNSPHDLPVAWGSAPIKMLAVCKQNIEQAWKAARGR